MTKEEFKDTVKRIYTEAGIEVIDDKIWCKGLGCMTNCPFRGEKFCILDEASVNKLFNTFEFVEQWAKDHPIVTNADKHKEVWGHEPKTSHGSWICPAGAIICPNSSNCLGCAETFWNAEYREPKKEGE